MSKKVTISVKEAKAKAKVDKVVARTGGAYGPPEGAGFIAQVFEKVPRFSMHMLAAFALFGLTVWLAPQTGATAEAAQVNVVQTLAYALSRMSLGGVMGFLLWRASFKNVRIDFTSPRDPVTAKLIESRGLIVAVGMLTLGLSG